MEIFSTYRFVNSAMLAIALLGIFGGLLDSAATYTQAKIALIFFTVALVSSGGALGFDFLIGVVIAQHQNEIPDDKQDAFYSSPKVEDPISRLTMASAIASLGGLFYVLERAIPHLGKGFVVGIILMVGFVLWRLRRARKVLDEIVAQHKASSAVAENAAPSRDEAANSQTRTG